MSHMSHITHPTCNRDKRFILITSRIGETGMSVEPWYIQYSNKIIAIIIGIATIIIGLVALRHQRRSKKSWSGKVFWPNSTN